MKRNIIFLFRIVFLSAATGYLVGANCSPKVVAKNIAHPSITKLNRLMTDLTQDYVDKINADSLVRVVIEDIVDELDPHSVFIPEVQNESLAESMKGNFEGIGETPCFFAKIDSKSSE